MPETTIMDPPNLETSTDEDTLTPDQEPRVERLIKRMWAHRWNDYYTHEDLGTPPKTAYTRWMNPQAAINLASWMPPRYNGFKSTTLAAAIARMPTPNKIMLAREHSPAVYVWTQDAGATMDAFDNTPGSPDELGSTQTSTVPLRGHYIGNRVMPGIWCVVRAWWD